MGKGARAQDAQPCDGGVTPRRVGVREVRKQAIELAGALRYAASSSTFFFLAKIHAKKMLMM